MRKIVLIALAAGVVLLAGVSLMLNQKLQLSRSEYTALEADEQATRSRYGAALEEIAAIQDSLNAIVLGEDGLKALETELDREKDLSQGRGDAAIARIEAIKAGIERTKAKIEELEDKLQAGGVQMAGLQKMITGLRRTVAEKETQIGLLTARVDSLQTQVTGLEAEVQQHSATIQAQAVAIEDKRRELGTVYYTIGSKKELKAAGVIVSKGGVLGLGKTIEPSGQIDESLLTPLDTDQQTVIHIPSKKAKLLSDQPPASYELQAVGEELELRILDPRLFRTVKHVIIMKS
jgi:predicted  nucleic acid-binding Zn-ribbon protein